MLWLATTLDLFKSALEMRCKELAHMTREHWIHLAGWALMIGAVAFAGGMVLGSFETSYWDSLGGTDGLYEYGNLVGSIVATLLISLGLFGLAARYGAAAGAVGRWSLLLAGGAGLVALLGGILMALATGDGWAVWVSGFAAMILGLLVFGITALRRPVLERWRAAPLIASLPLVLLLGLIPYQALVDPSLEPNKLLTATAVLLLSIGLFLLGRLMQGESRMPEALPA